MASLHKNITQRWRVGHAPLVLLPRSLRLVWTAAPHWTTAWICLLIVQGVLPVATVYLTKLIIDSFVATTGSNVSWAAIQPILVLVGLLAAVLLVSELVQSGAEWVRTAQGEYVQDHIQQLVQQQSVAVDLAFYESPAYHDQLEQAQSQAATRSQALLENTGTLIQNGITLVAMIGVLLPYGAWLPGVLIVSTLPALFVVVRFDQQYHRWWQRSTADRRRAFYYNALLTESHTAAELRLFGLGSHFQTAYQTVRQRLRNERLQLVKIQSVARLGAGVVALLITGVVMVWMVWRALQGVLSLGDLVLFYQALSRGQTLMRTLLSNLGQLYSNSLFLGNLFSFLALTPTVHEPTEPMPMPLVIKQGVEFRHVTFRYPGSERVALEDFNLHIPANKIVAIVGVNGAGKTTLVKLLCRFYDPDAGTITIDGVDLRRFKLADLRRAITMLFQFPIPFYMTARDNVALGNVTLDHTMAEIEAATRSAGAHEIVARLPQGYDTPLGKLFANGAELSGGEWQRIATARAFLRQAPIVVLDEPTSAMDSWAEADWFDRLRALTQGRTGLIITHRFTIAMRADIIHVMHAGRIIESGRHDQLLALNGHYAQSWAAQLQANQQLEPRFGSVGPA